MSERYPTSYELKRIEKWPHTEGFKELLEYVKSIWWEPGWGWKQSGRKYWISTGGWSGNEELIGAMHNNFIFWSQCFVQHRRGGHYILEIPKPNKEKAVK